MATEATQTIGQLSVEEFRELIGQIVEEKLQSYLGALCEFYEDEEGIKIAVGRDPEEELPFQPEFEEGLERALEDVRAGRTLELEEVRKRYRV